MQAYDSATQVDHEIHVMLLWDRPFRDVQQGTVLISAFILSA